MHQKEKNVRRQQGLNFQACRRKKGRETGDLKGDITPGVSRT